MDVSSETDEIVWKLIISMHTTCLRKKLAKRYYFFEKSIRFHEIIKIQNSANLIHIFFYYTFFRCPQSWLLPIWKKSNAKSANKVDFKKKYIKMAVYFETMQNVKWRKCCTRDSLSFLSCKQGKKHEFWNICICFIYVVLVYSITKKGRTFPYFTSAIASK